MNSSKKKANQMTVPHLLPKAPSYLNRTNADHRVVEQAHWTRGGPADFQNVINEFRNGKTQKYQSKQLEFKQDHTALIVNHKREHLRLCPTPLNTTMCINQRRQFAKEAVCRATSWTGILSMILRTSLQIYKRSVIAPQWSCMAPCTKILVYK